MRSARLLVCVVALVTAGCVLDAIPENTLAGNLTLTAERLALLEAIQPTGTVDGRFAVDLECKDGSQVILARSYLDETGVGVFEIVIPASDQPQPWSCNFSAPGTVKYDCVQGQCDFDTRFGLGTLRACDADRLGFVFSWDGESQWLDDVVADGYDACVSLDDPEVDNESLVYDFEPLTLDAVTWCGNVTVRQSIDSGLGTAVGWSPFLCYRLYSFGGEEFVEAAAYRGIELGTEKTGCPLIGPLSWRVIAQDDGALGFTSRPPGLNNPSYAAQFDLDAVLWDKSERGPEGSFALTAWAGGFTGGIQEFDEGVPGGMVLETSGPMVPLGLVDIPTMLLRDTLEGCADERGERDR